MSYLEKLEDLVNAFNEGFESIENPEELIKATESANEAILKMTLSDEDKNALATACIDAASLIDIDSNLSRQDVINSFKANLTEELEHLDSSRKSISFS